MLTVKIVSLNGHEIVEEADTIVFYPARETGTVDTLNIFKDTRKYIPSDSAGEITSGHIYVMNENGKTIANYHLFPPKPVFEQFTKEQEEAFNNVLDDGNRDASLKFNCSNDGREQPDTGESGKKL